MAEGTRKAIGKRRRKRQIIIIALFAAMMLIALLILVMMTNVDKRFIRSLSRGVSEGWALENNEIDLKDKNGPNDTKFIDIEYESVKEFKGCRFKDENLGALAAEYIRALENCKTVIAENDPNGAYDEFWNAFSQDYGKRLTALYDIYNGDYGLTFSGKDIDREIEELQLSGWSLKKTAEIKFVRLEESTEDISNVVFVASVNNDSGFDLDYINIEIELYDKDENLIETAIAYADDIKKGSDFELKCYQTATTKADAYLITSVSCRKSNGKVNP